MMSRTRRCSLALLAGVFASALSANLSTAAVPAPATVPAFHDPADQPFRRAPMAQSSRSIVISLRTNLHLAFDAALLRTHTVWQGESLNLYGPPYNGTATRFVCDYSGRRLWGNLPRSPWIFDAAGAAVTATAPGRFKGHLQQGTEASFVYEITPPGEAPFAVIESPRWEQVGDHDVIVRRFEVSPLHQRVRFMAHDEPGDPLNLFGVPGSEAIRLPGGVLIVVLRGLPGNALVPSIQSLPVPEPLLGERDGKGPYSILTTNLIAGRKTSLRVTLAPSKEMQIFEIASVLCADSKSGNELAKQIAARPLRRPPVVAKPPAPTLLLPDPDPVDRFSGDDFYRVEQLPLPKDLKLTISGMDFLPNGDLALCTLQGDVFVIENAQGKAPEMRWRRLARGLNEPGGLRVVDGQLYVMQKCELTRLRDGDGDGVADIFECVSDAWGYTGNYHSFATGPAVDRDGNLYALITGHRPIFEVPLMGCALKISPVSTVDTTPFSDQWRNDPFCYGLRVPNGFGEYAGDLFMTDNQGHWVAANKLNHLQPAKFYGYPSAFPAPRERFHGDPNFTPPAIWFPYPWVRSASGLGIIGDARFGPFTGQMLVGEFQNAAVFRVALERVNGEWQGAVFPFVRGFASGVNRLAYGPDSKLYVGGLRLGHWTSIAPQPQALERVSFTGQVPFEIREARAQTNGFDLHFTRPVNPASAGRAENWDALQYTYGYDGRHEAPEKDRDEKVAGPVVKIRQAIVSADKRTVRLVIEGLMPQHVIMVRGLEITNEQGQKLRHDTFHYTLNQIPTPPAAPAPPVP